MNTVRKDNKSDTHNETDMTEVQYKNITDQAQGTGNLLNIINARLIQMDVNAESRRLEVKRDIEKSVAQVEKRVTRLEESVAQVIKSIETLRLKMEQNTKELKQELKKDIEDLRGSVNRDLRLIMLSIGTIGAVLIPLTMAIVYKLFI